MWRYWRKIQLWWSWLGRMRCPVCDGQGELLGEPDEAPAGVIIVWCDACDGTGEAA